MRRAATFVGTLAAVALVLAGCGSSKASPRGSLTIVVNAPFSRTPYLGRTIEDGARLAAREVNVNGVRIGGTTYSLRIRTADSALSPATAVANVRRAVGEHAVAIVDEGTGVDASWRVAARQIVDAQSAGKFLALQRCARRSGKIRFLADLHGPDARPIDC